MTGVFVDSGNGFRIGNVSYRVCRGSRLGGGGTPWTRRWVSVGSKGFVMCVPVWESGRVENVDVLKPEGSGWWDQHWIQCGRILRPGTGKSKTLWGGSLEQNTKFHNYSEEDNQGSMRPVLCSTRGNWIILWGTDHSHELTIQPLQQNQGQVFNWRLHPRHIDSGW